MALGPYRPGAPGGRPSEISVPIAQPVDDRAVRPVVAPAGLDQMGELVMQRLQLPLLSPRSPPAVSSQCVSTSALDRCWSS